MMCFYVGNLDKAITISTANRRIRDSVPMEDCLSYSLFTAVSELGVMQHVVEKILDHELGWVLTFYNKHDWLKEQLEG
ncbi:hypothetical protein ACP5PY_02970 [Photobacterium leiognathi subsp. mandapamensis]